MLQTVLSLTSSENEEINLVHNTAVPFISDETVTNISSHNVMWDDNWTFSNLD